MAEAAEDRTQAPSPRRLQRAREQGQTAVSREFSVLASLAAASGALLVQPYGSVVASLAVPMMHPELAPGMAIWLAGGTVLGLVWPAAVAGCAASLLATWLQSGFLVHAAALAPTLSRISPASGLKRLFGVQGLVQTGKSLLKLGAIGWCLWHVAHALLPILFGGTLLQPGQILGQLRTQLVRLFLPLLAMQTVVTVIDVAWVRFDHARRLRMSRQELVDENKETEGNPMVRQRIRQIGRARAKRRMMAAVPKAAVVVTNPTHYAIALAYEQGSSGAPRVVAKGADLTAARIREIAHQHRIPIVANPPLARALYAVELDTQIPAEHFKAVAEIIAYVWRLRRPSATR